MAIKSKSKEANALLTTKDIPIIIARVISILKQGQPPLEPGYVDMKPMPRNSCPSCRSTAYDKIQNDDNGEYYECQRCGFTWLFGSVRRYTPVNNRPKVKRVEHVRPKPIPDGELADLFAQFYELRKQADKVNELIIKRIHQFNFSRETVVHCMEQGMDLTHAEAQARYSRLKRLLHGDHNPKVQSKGKRKS